MNVEFYRIVHFSGLFLTVFALGAYCMHGLSGGTKKTNNHRALLSMTHGLGLLLALIGGFGLHAKLHISGFPLWLILKMAVWAVFGFMIVPISRMPHIARQIWSILIACTLFALYLAVYRPV